jgi:hypothetical protein
MATSALSHRNGTARRYRTAPVRNDTMWKPQKQTAGQPSSGRRPQSGKRVAYFR